MRVEATVVGRSGAAIEPRTVDIAWAQPAPLRDVITELVLDEVRSYNERERSRRLIRVLTPDEIDQGVAVGKIDSGGRERTGPARTDEAVAAALEGFADGLYFVFVDGVQVEDLDAAVTIDDDTRVRFVRLVALAGGC